MRNFGWCVLLVAGCGAASRTPVGTGTTGSRPDMAMAGATTSGGGDMASTSNPTGMTFNDMCNGQPTTISGVVTAPNGHDPIANAFAYVINSRGDFPPTVACELCNMPVDSVSATATTKVDGSFTLDIGTEPVSATLEVTVNKGRFRHTGTVTVQPCMDNSDADTALPGKAASGVDDIPKIAVATGNQDQLDTVLEAMGLDSTLGFDCYEGREPPAAGKTLKALTSPCGKRPSLSPIETLLTNETMLESYNLVFLSCAPYKFSSLTAAQQQQIVANLQTWTGKGGRLFVTDNSYDYIAQAFPSAISFLDGNTTIDAANQGVGGTSSAPDSYNGVINDTTLASWMSTIGAIPSGTNTLSLTGYLSHWTVIGSLPMNTTDVVDATNAVAFGTGTRPSPSPGPASTYPQSVKFDIDAPAGGACGRAIYTSYHTLLSTTSSVDPNVMLSPQERILEYLMFEAGACVGPIS